MPTKVTGKCGSVTIRLIPAPRGAGIVAARTPKKVLQMAGIEDCYTGGCVWGGMPVWVCVGVAQAAHCKTHAPGARVFLTCSIYCAVSDNTVSATSQKTPPPNWPPSGINACALVIAALQ